MNEMSTITPREPLVPSLAYPMTMDEIECADTETLKSALSQALKLTAQALAYLAAIWKELERRGEDLTNIKSGLADYLPSIAQGTLEPEVVVKYAGQRMLVRAISQLPQEKQLELVHEGTISAVVMKEGEPKIIEKYPLEMLGSQELRFVFKEGEIRPIEEQMRMRMRHATRAPRAIRAASSVELNAERETIVVDGKPAKIKSVLRAISDYYGFDAKKVLDNHKATRQALSQKVGR